MLIDNLANLSRSTRNTIFVVMIIIATIAMYNWVVTPHITNLYAAQQYESVVNEAEKKNKVATREVEDKKKKLEQLYEQLDKVQNSMSTSYEAQEFFSNLQADSEEAGCTVNSLNLIVKEPSSGKKRKRTEYASNIVANSAMLTVSGDYNSILRLVKKLQNHTKRIWMDSFKIITTDSDLLKCDMTITIYTVEEKPVL